MKVRRLSINGLDLFTSYRDKFGNTFLHQFAEENNNDLVEFLIDRQKKCCGYTELKPNKANESALHKCSISNNVKCAKLLIESGANPDYGNMLGWTPLTQSILSNSLDVFKYLATIDFVYINGIKTRYLLNPIQKDIYGYTPIHYIFLSRNKDFFQSIIVERMYKEGWFYILNNEPNHFNKNFISIYNKITYKDFCVKKDNPVFNDCFTHDTNW